MSIVFQMWPFRKAGKFCLLLGLWSGYTALPNSEVTDSTGTEISFHGHLTADRSVGNDVRSFLLCAFFFFVTRRMGKYRQQQILNYETIYTRLTVLHSYWKGGSHTHLNHGHLLHNERIRINVKFVQARDTCFQIEF